MWDTAPTVVVRSDPCVQVLDETGGSERGCLQKSKYTPRDATAAIGATYPGWPRGTGGVLTLLLFVDFPPLILASKGDG